MPVQIRYQPLTAYGVTAASVSAWRDGPQSVRNFRGLTNSAGGVFASRATGQAREMTLAVNIPAATIGDRATGLDAMDEALQGLVPLTFDDAPGRVIRVICTGRTVVGVGGADPFVVRPVVATYTLTAADGASYDVEPMIYALGTTPVPLSLGTLPSLGIVQLMGSWTGERTITYRAPNGVVYGTLGITVPGAETLLATEYLELDLSRRTIVRVGPTGTRVSVYAWKSSGRWFAPDPTDSTRALGAAPTLALSGGTGLYLTRRAWSV
jgi:hypothetical protein